MNLVGIPISPKTLTTTGLLPTSPSTVVRLSIRSTPGKYTLEGFIDLTLIPRLGSASHISQMEPMDECPWCEMPAKNLRRCSRCKKATYCSEKCQKEAWPSHIFKCQPGQHINTAYRLYKACLGDVIPTDEETREDYGFAKAARTMGGRSENMLCGLYRGLFLFGPQIPPKDVHKWRLEGRLVQGIKDAFETLPPANRGGYFPWFLEHQSVLETAVPDDELILGYTSNAIRSAWIMTGGSPSDSLNVIDTKIRGLSPPRRACHIIYRGFSDLAHPNPIQDEWIDFGFVATSNSSEEHALGVAYQALIRVCTFEQFCTAHESSSIPALFERYGLQYTRHFRDVMAHSPYTRKSVWDLKHYVDKVKDGAPGDDASEATPVRSVTADYGYMNYRKAGDGKLLDTAYKRYFAHPQTDPIALHEACIQGNLLPYLAPFVHWKASQKKAYTRLLKNAYPLPQPFEYAGITCNGGVTIHIRGSDPDAASTPSR
ncbi:hypothetical protein TRAPUB_5994 [Trametes pubescens]|uniref:MYND-type domain-containing protein n=1 Tax=Trametes pubescens TaxID=154538 RepID=A0A1M2V788_TRAPU|nr:hypothetical protein TRAPUB_5994 [Trametes pubescens]